MPRARSATPKGYPNRTDLQGPATVPIAAAPNQPYGQAGAQIAAQRAVPMAAPGGPPPAAASGQAPDLQALAAQFNGPGNSMALNRPTERPDEPVTHGLPVGPGAGPEALTGIGAAARNTAIGQGTLGNLLTSMAARPGASAAIQALAARAMTGAQ